MPSDTGTARVAPLRAALLDDPDRLPLGGGRPSRPAGIDDALALLADEMARAVPEGNAMMPDGALIQAPPSRGDATPALLPLTDARARLLQGAAPVPGEQVLTPAAALGRMLVAAPRAALSLPPFDQSAMDGYALHAADLAPAAAPRVLRRVAAGEAPGPAIGPGEAVRVMTGAAVPRGAAAVVMEEHVAFRDGGVLTHRPLRPGTNIRRQGEDLVAGDVLLAPGTRLDARHLALLAAAGVDWVAVRRPVRVALLSNGNELGTVVRDSNRPMLAALLAGPAIALTDLGVLPDDPAALADALRRAAAGHDLILASGGISGSDADHLPGALRAAGGEVAVLKLALKPGKPLAHGRLGGTPCLFLPGNPLAALVGFLALGRPLLARLAGLAQEMGPPPVVAVAARGFARNPGREEFLPARVIGQDDIGLPLVEPSGPFGASRLTPLAAADGLLWLAPDVEEVRPGEALRFHPFAASFGLF